MTTTTGSTAPARPGRYIGPPLPAPALAHVALFAASIAIGASAGVFGTPSTPAAELADRLADGAGAARWVATLQLGAAVALGVFTAAATSAARTRVPAVAGLDIARFGGWAAAGLMGTSALATWAATELAAGAGGAGAAVRSLTLLSFATGGPGYVVTSGLLVAGLAVPALLMRLTPRWVAVLGLAVAAVSELCVLTLALPAMNPLLPLARFPGLVWIVAAAFTLPPAGARRDLRR